jgi:tRNA(fMet)-specific endonuclease VapC
MRLFVLDTDVLTLYREGHPVVSRRVLAQQPSDLAVTVISVEEQLSGWYALLRRARRPDQIAAAYQWLADAVRFLSGLEILSFTEAAIARYTELKAMKINNWTSGR